MAKKLPFYGIGIVAVIAVLYFASGGDFGGLGTFSSDSVFDFRLLSFTNTNIDCFIKFTLLVDGRIIGQSEFVGGTSGRNPILNLVDRFDGTKFNEYDIILKARCNHEGGEFVDIKGGQNVGGFSISDDSVVSLFVSSHDPVSSKGISLTTQQKHTKQVLLLNDREHTIATWKVQASDLDKRFGESNQPYRVQIAFDVLGDFRFEFTDPANFRAGTIKANFGDLSRTHLLNIEKIKAPTPDPIKRNSLIHIEEVSRTIDGKSLIDARNKLDTSEASGRQIKIIGLVRDWDSSEGNPIVTIKFGSKSLINIKMLLDDLINDKEDAIFKALYSVDRNSPEGQYDITMILNGRSGTSNIKFWVDNGMKLPPPNPNGITPVLMTDQPTDLKDSAIFFFYVIKFNESCTQSVVGTQLVTTCDTETPISDLTTKGFNLLPLQSITTNLVTSKQNEPISSITLTPIFSVLGGSQTCGSGPQAIKDCDADKLSKLQVISSDIKFQISAGGKSLPERGKGVFVPSGALCGANANNCRVGIKLGETIISAGAIEGKLAGKDGQLKVEWTGTFQVKDSASGEVFTGKAQGATFTLPINSGTGGGGNGEEECSNGIASEGFVCRIEDCPAGTSAKAVTPKQFRCIDDTTGDDVCVDDDGNEIECPKECDTGSELLDGICEAIGGGGENKQCPDNYEDVNGTCILVVDGSGGTGGENECTQGLERVDGVCIEIVEDDGNGGNNGGAGGTVITGCTIFGTDVCAFAISAVSLEDGVLEFDDNLIFIVIGLLVIGGIIAFATRQSRFSPVPSRF